MKTVFHGNISNALDQAKKTALKSYSEFKIIDAEEFLPKDVLIDLFSDDLFGVKPIIIIRAALTGKNADTWIDFLLSSDCELLDLIFAENEISKTFEKKLDKSFVLKKVESEKKAETDFFDSILVSALASKDKKALWLRFRKAVEEGKRAEELFGMLIWQMKAIIIVKKCKNVSESGLSPFAYKSALNFSKNWNVIDAEKMLINLVDAYHLPRVRGGEAEVYLEQVILSSF